MLSSHARETYPEQLCRPNKHLGLAASIWRSLSLVKDFNQLIPLLKRNVCVEEDNRISTSWKVIPKELLIS